MQAQNLLDRAFWPLLTGLLLAIYLPGIGNELIFDDARLTDGTVFESYGSLLELRQRALSYGSFVWVEAIVGEGWWKQRWVNLLLHAGVVVLLYAFFARLLAHACLGDEVESAPGFLASRRAALRIGVALFALNPVAVYAVGYLIQRSIVLATLWVLVALIAFLRGVEKGGWPWFVLALSAYVLAVSAKEHAVTAVALAVPVYVFVKRPPGRRIAVLVAAAGAVLVAGGAVLVQIYGNIAGEAFDDYSRQYAAQLESLRPGVTDSIYPLSVVNQAALFFKYGLLWFVPVVAWMSIDLRPVFPLSMTAFPHVLGVVAYLAVSGFSAWAVLRRSDVFGWVGLCLLIPVTLFATEFALPWLQDPFVLYRSYLWAIGVPGVLCILLVGTRPVLIYAIGGVVALVFALLAFERNLSLENETSVWSDAAAKIDLQAPPNAVGRWRPYLNRGSRQLANDAPERALPDFERADALGEPNGSARFNIGVALQMLGRHADAVEALILAERKGFTEGALYYHRAESRHALGRYADAFADYGIALQKTSDPVVVAHMRLRRAEAAIPIQQYDVAVGDFELLLEAQPDDYRLLMGLGMAHVGRQDGAKALPIFDRLIAMRATAAAHYGRGLARFLSGDKLGALADLDLALDMEPGNAAFRAHRAQIAAQP